MVGTREVLPLHTPRALGSWASQRSEQLLVLPPEGILREGVPGHRSHPQACSGASNPNLTPYRHTPCLTCELNPVSAPLSFPDCPRECWGALSGAPLFKRRGVLPMN